MKHILTALLLLASVSTFAGGNPDKTDMSGQKLEGKLVGSRCPEANAEIQIKTTTQKLWLQCQTNATICSEACSNNTKVMQKRYSGKTLNITLGKSQQWPPANNYVHFIESVETK